MSVIRTGVFVDAENLRHTMRSLGIDAIDYDLLKEELAGGAGRFCKVFRYYVPINTVAATHQFHMFLRRLSYQGWEVVSRKYQPMTRPDGHVSSKSSMDVEMAVDIVSMAGELDEIVIVSGDSDFLYLVQYLRKLGKHVTIVAHLTDPEGEAPSDKSVSWEMRRICTEFRELSVLLPQIRFREP